MDSVELTAVRQSHVSLLRDLDPRDVAPYLYQEGWLTEEQYDDICTTTRDRKTNCQLFLRYITHPSSQCSFDVFIQALNYNNCYPFLADKLESQLQKCKDPQNLSNNDVEMLPRQDVKGNEKCNSSGILYEPVGKISVFTKTRKKMANLSHKLKRLSHNGDLVTFKSVTDTINDQYLKHKLSSNHSIKGRMEFADMRFTSLEAEASAKRVKYDTSINDCNVFKEMESVIPFTSNPRVSSMTYLARYGSAKSMESTIDQGLAFLEFAKEHAEYVTPCKDTGMVYYIEVNLLTQKYEKSPSPNLKENILKTVELAIGQFGNESDDIKTDYQRMLMLKMVFCYLGIGLFGKRIENVEATETDKEKAKQCLDFIEKPDIWSGMEKRRKMLFFIAKSEYYRQQDTTELAVIHAKEAEVLATENQWKAELPNIQCLLQELGDRNANADRDTKASLQDLVGSILADIGQSENFQ